MKKYFIKIYFFCDFNDRLRRSSRDDKSRAIFVVGLGLSLSTDPIGLDGAR